MLKRCVPVFKTCSRHISLLSEKRMKVTVVGGAGGIGQPLSMLLKTSPLITQVTLHDLAKHVPGVAVDISHIDTNSAVKSFVGPETLCEALKGSDVVIVPAGVPRKPGMSRDDLFNVNAQLILDLTSNFIKACPDALLAIITNPVNTVVPIAAEVMKKKGCFDKNKLFGVTTLDLVRSSTFVAQAKNLQPTEVQVNCIGGHSGITIIPILSQTSPIIEFCGDEIAKLTTKIQNAGTEVVKAKAGAGSATLSMAWAANRFVLSLVRGLSGESGVVECSYVASEVTEASFFSTPLLLGRNGVCENMGLPCLSEFEQKLVCDAVPELKKNIEKGVQFVKEKLKS